MELELSNEDLMIIEESLSVIVDICEAKDLDPEKTGRIRDLKTKIHACLKGEANEQSNTAGN